MKITAKVDYACKALLELSMHWPSTTPMRLAIIAERQNIPIKFLNQIFISLKQFGYVQSIRGKSGGYTLAIQPKEIILNDVVNNFSEKSSHPKGVGVMSLIWDEVTQTVADKMNQISFETIVNRKHSADNTVMFEI